MAKRTTFFHVYGLALALPMVSSLSTVGAAADNTTVPPALTTSAGQPAPIETKAYVDQAAAADLFEIESSKLAQQKSKNTQVQAFAKMMIHDHAASTAKLKTILKAGRMDEPPSTLPPDLQTQLDGLKAQSGETFDAAYVKAQLEGHQAALQLHQSYAATGTDKKLRAFAAQTAKVVQKHLDHVQMLAKKLNIAA
ncbi:MAG TPA: DUF4142 domain-containing protein [Dongiaceae bacterium]|nr:DUF4142 domain-containing protein [Dongiaceae bacterium]